MTQPTERRFVMEPRLDAEVETINEALATKVETTDARLSDQRTPLDNSVTSAKIVDGTIVNADIANTTIESAKLAAQDYIKFDTTYAGGSQQPGELAWDADNETLEFQLDSHVTLQIGQEHVLRVKNASGSVAIPERTVVMFAGATGDTITVAPAISDGSINVNYLAGITTEEIPADGFGFVTQLGFINQVNTNGWAVGTILYVDPTVAGGLTPTEPEIPAWTMPVAAVTKQSPTAGRMLVRAIPGGSGAGGSSVVISDTVPAGGTKGDLWLDSTDGTMYVYFEDVDGSQWIQVQANSALEGSILQRLSSLESQAIAYGNPNPNVIINGAFDIWQRGTSAVSTGYSTADRWYLGTSQPTTTYSQETSLVPESCRYAIKMTQATNAATVSISQVIETSNAVNLAGKTVTLSSYGMSSGTTTVRNRLYYSTTVDNARTNGWTEITAAGSATYSVTSAGYTRGSTSFAVPSNAKTILVIVQSHSPIAVGESLYLSGVQLEAGSTATAFRRNAPSIQAELAACQRYYYRVTAGGAYGAISTGYAISINAAQTFIKHPVTMRAKPAAVTYGGTLRISNYLANYTFATLTMPSVYGSAEISAIEVGGISPNMTFGTGATILALNDSAAYIAVDAEL